MFKFTPSDPANQRILITDLADIQYAGQNGVTQPCIEAIARILQEGGSINNAVLLTWQESHAFLLIGEYDEITAIKAGFTSGYAGEGPRGLATALAILCRHKIEIEEHKVDEAYMRRVEHSCLLHSDIEIIKNSNPVRPRRWHNYAYEQKISLHASDPEIARYYSNPIPFRLIDPRIMDLAIDFHKNPDNALISTYRRLEDIVRHRAKISGEGHNLFSRAFLHDDSPLTWKIEDKGELKGRASLFSAVFMAYRNSRVHRESSREFEDELRELLLVNELFRLEACAVERPKPAKDQKDER